jgi:uncharacterized damage-inducible protein DinB
MEPWNREQLRDLYAYTDWANDRLCEMLIQAFGEEAELRQHSDPRVRTIQETATHIVAAQAIWRERWQGNSPTQMLNPAEYPTPLALKMAFRAERARFWGWFETLAEEDFARSVDYRAMQGQAFTHALWKMMLHVVTHGGYHRGQITGRLLDLGFDALIQSTDLIAYYREKDLETAAMPG